MSDTITAACAGGEGHTACGHGRCRACGGCADCDRADAEAIRAAITRRLAEAGDDIEEALAYVNSADVALTELTSGWLSDADLAESGAGDDARQRLAQAAASLRDVARIIENRQLREHIIALEDDRAGPEDHR